MQLKWRNIFKVHFRDSIVSVICSSCKNFSSVQQAKRHTRSKEIAGTYSCIILFTNYSSLTMATSIILFSEQVWSFSNKRWPILIDFFGKIKIYYKFFNILRFCTLGHHNKVQKIQPNTIFFQKCEKTYIHKTLILPVVFITSWCLEEQHWLTVSVAVLQNERYVFFTCP